MALYPSCSSTSRLPPISLPAELHKDSQDDSTASAPSFKKAQQPPASSEAVAKTAQPPAFKEQGSYRNFVTIGCPLQAQPQLQPTAPAVVPSPSFFDVPSGYCGSAGSAAAGQTPWIVPSVSRIECEPGNAGSAAAGQTFEPGTARMALYPSSSPAELHEDSQDDSTASAPSFKKARQPPASPTCADSQSSAPPFDPKACGNHLGDKKRKCGWWGRKGCNELPPSYWSSKSTKDPAIDMVVEFFQLRLDRNGEPISNKFGTPEQRDKGWWRLPITSSGNSSSEQFKEPKTAWHGTNFRCVYSIMYHEELVESKENIKNGTTGVYRS